MPRSSSPLYTPAVLLVALAQATLLLLGTVAVAGQVTGPAVTRPLAVAGNAVTSTLPSEAPPATSGTSTTRATAAVRRAPGSRPEPAASARPTPTAPSARPRTGPPAALRTGTAPREVAPPSIPTSLRVTRRRSSPSLAQELRAAVHRVPDQRARESRWVISRKYDSWGTADWYRNTVYISPDVPRERLDDVVLHEWSHLASVLPYGGNVQRAVASMNSWFGGSRLTGAERAADCMARLQGAAWTRYTRCDDPRWREGATRLLRGKTA